MHGNSYSRRRQFHSPHEQGTTDRLARAKRRITIFVLFQIYGVAKLGDRYFSPVRDDGLNPSFAVREDGQVGYDHGTGIGYNVLTLIAQIEHLSPAEACRRLIFYAEGGSYSPQGRGMPSAAAPIPQVPSWQCLPQTRIWNTLVVGTHYDYWCYAKLRGLNPESLMRATAMGLFFFKETSRRVLGVCTITDHARYVRQDRCVLGGTLATKTGERIKNRTIGAASWPVGAANIGDKPVVLLVEGLPDLLSMVQVILEEGRLHDAAPVAMLGAGQHINVHALPYFAGKVVRIFPDQDEAGAKGAATWTQQLRGVAASVDCFSFAAYPADHTEAGQGPQRLCAMGRHGCLQAHDPEHGKERSSAWKPVINKTA